MKNVLYLLTISLAMATSAFAQKQLLPRVNFGVKGGVNLTNYSTTGTLTDESRLGLQAGVYSRISLGALHLQPELYYTQKDAKVMQTNNPYVNTVKLRSIDLPVLLGYSWGGDYVAWHVQTGPLVSFGVSNKESDNAYQTQAGLLIADQNYSWLAGLGVDVNNRLSFDARYEYGFKKFQATDFRSTARLNVFSIAVAYRLFSL